MKNEVILINPSPEGFIFKGIPLNSYLYTKVRAIYKAVRKPNAKLTFISPLNVLSIGTALKAAGYKPIIIDGTAEDVRDKIRIHLDENTLFVGISAMTGSQITFGLKSAKFVRNINPNIPLVWGGLHPTVLPEETLSTSKYADIVCIGEGEITIVELANALQIRLF
ncbi:MAG: cobalamin B12-binding domain-containing protein [Nitrospirae bacterium]|nr:cobalamin B12-binding domain-containing protein [Nitrospirota bacterium]